MKARSDVELLAELEKEAAELQTTIGVLKRRIGVPSNNGATAPLSASLYEDIKIQDKPFLGMSIPEAARKYLQRVREPKSPQEISEALRQGGLHSRSTDFMGVIRTTLVRKGRGVGIESYGSGKWGLSEWRPSRAKIGSTDEAEDS